MLVDYEADVNAQDIMGLTPLHLAVVSPRPQAVQVLLECDAVADSMDLKGWRPVDFAVTVGLWIACHSSPFLNLTCIIQATFKA